MTLRPDSMEEIALLARKLAEFARAENEANLASCLESIAEGATRAATHPTQVADAVRELQEAYLALMAPKETGLANFFRWHPDIEVRRDLNTELDDVRQRLELLLLTPN